MVPEDREATWLANETLESLIVSRQRDEKPFYLYGHLDTSSPIAGMNSEPVQAPFAFGRHYAWVPVLI
jgi:hypothetical protein